MTSLARRQRDTTTYTPISDASASPLRVASLPTPELSDLKEPRWRKEVKQRLEDILTLDEGWDGYTAGPLRRDVVAFAIQVLHQVMHPTTPPPHVIPMSHEGLMIEWHEHGIDLEIEIETPGHLWVSFEDALEHIEDEYALRTDLRRLEIPIDKLTKRGSVIQR